VNQAGVKLGSISLGDFLQLMYFDEQGNVCAMRLAEAFRIASHLDGETSKGVGFKAEAFRRWMVTHGDG
jgi:hypothetical protein